MKGTVVLRGVRGRRRPLSSGLRGKTKAGARVDQKEQTGGVQGRKLESCSVCLGERKRQREDGGRARQAMNLKSEGTWCLVQALVFSSEGVEDIGGLQVEDRVALASVEAPTRSQVGGMQVGRTD